MDFYNEDSRPRPSQAWQDARDEVASRDSFRNRAVPILWTCVHDGDITRAIDIADALYAAIEARAQSDMEAIAHLKEQK